MRESEPSPSRPPVSSSRVRPIDPGQPGSLSSPTTIRQLLGILALKIPSRSLLKEQLAASKIRISLLSLYEVPHSSLQSQQHLSMSRFSAARSPCMFKVQSSLQCVVAIC